MSKSKHTEAQMIAALKQVEAGRKVEDVAGGGFWGSVPRQFVSLIGPSKNQMLQTIPSVYVARLTVPESRWSWYRSSCRLFSFEIKIQKHSSKANLGAKMELFISHRVVG
jgi:hypothetical protein